MHRRELEKIIVSILNFVLPKNPHLRRVCGPKFREQLKTWNIECLWKKFEFIIKNLKPREIAEVHGRRLLIHNRLVKIVGNVIIHRRIQDYNIFSSLMTEYSDNTRGKSDSKSLRLILFSSQYHSKKKCNNNLL